MDLFKHLLRQIVFSRRTFGPDPRQAGVADHIRKELAEIEAAATADARLKEWIDVIILGLDGAWRSQIETGAADTVIAARIVAAIEEKQSLNEARVWPDWRAMPTDRAIEHDRSRDNA